MTVTTMAARVSRPSTVSYEHADDWRDRSACRDKDPDLFFPDTAGPAAEALQRAGDAQAICWSCPVVTQCRLYADASGQRSGVWAGVWRDALQAREDEERDALRAQAATKRAQAVRELRRQQGRRAKAARQMGAQLALERGTEVILARLRGQDDDTIAVWAGVSVQAVRRALMILLPPVDDARIDVTGMEQVLRHARRLESMVDQGCTDREIARVFRTQWPVVAQARQILAHRAAAAKKVRKTTSAGRRAAA